MAVEQPSYKVEIDAKPFQIRDYAPMIVACVHENGTREAAVSGGFRTLASYISGNNQPSRKIVMTAPVTQSAGQKLAMTIPAVQVKSSEGWDVHFAMPASLTMQTLPKPNDDRIRLLEFPARRVAAISFSGFWTDANFRSHEMRLLEFLEQRGLKPVSTVTYAYFDPPWKPWFLRRNEVQFEIAK
jgi:effector-binding domain-containing protein